ncbi:MAG: cytochrome C [Rhodocyclaceae bacterium]|nr:cytochrome C [Rhodocyclaceae bacterium]
MRKIAIVIGMLAFASLVQGADAGSPQTNYMLHCSGCHGVDGSGSPGAGIPTMVNTLGHFLRVSGGRDFLVQVPGTSQSALPNGAVAELLNWILGKFSPTEIPPGSSPYSEQEVARLRNQPLDDVPAFRAEIVGRLKGIGIVIE